VHTLFVDESFRNNYILVGHLVETTRTGQLRKAFRSHVLRGQRSIHFVKESDTRRKYLLSQFQKLDCVAIFVELPLEDLRSARLRALKTLLASADDLQITSFVIERDETTVLSDKAALDLHNMVGGRKSLTYDFKVRHEEPLLWFADAIAWSIGRGGDWKSRVESMLIRSKPQAD
jgi:hypothetical protein